MKKFTMFACLALALVFALSSFADDLPEYTKGNSTLHGGSATFAKAGGDTINLMAALDDATNEPGEPTYRGDFEDDVMWGSLDITQPTSSHYSVSDYGFAAGTNLAAWCGDINIASCDDSLDPVGGYGNAWHDQIDFTAAVLDNGISATVNVDATLYNDTEPGYDFTFLSYQYNNEVLADIASWDGAQTVAVSGSVVYLPNQYMGGTDIRVLFRFKSDGGWSDADCSWPTYRGAHQVDDITVTIVQTGYADQVFFEDFETGDLNLGDGMGDAGSYVWSVALPDGVGDYAQIWEGLEDADPCNTNYTKQVAFIDDGVIVPGTGGSDCINWCYGPAGYIVNTLGGLAGPAEHIYNAIESPVMTWPNQAFDGILFSFGVYRHEDLSSDAPGMFYTWGVRSADTDGSAGDAQVLEDQPWLDRNFVYYGGPDYVRGGDDVTDLMNPGRDIVQVQTTVYELGWVWGWTGNDGYPAPYFDNFKVQIFPYVGPGISTRELDLANDGFPERGSIDFLDLGTHHVRFDMANNISLASHLNVDFGDSMVVDIVPVRAGSSLNGNPTINYVIDANPVFDPYRTAPTSDSVDGFPAIGQSGIWDGETWAFDLPDTGLLWPGDVLHYYIYAEDAIGGADIQSATLPGDISEFGDFSSPLAYNSTYTIHALPTINENGGVYSTPPILFWNDFANRGGEQEWYTALANAGKVMGEDYDIYYTNGPSSGVGNGLGGRAASDLNLEHYTDMLYTSGDLGVNTISNGDFNNDSSDDVGVLDLWLNQGGKDLFATGDDLVSDMAVNGGPLTLAFTENWFGVSFAVQDIRTFINSQAAPVVAATPGNPVFQNIDSWIAFGGCPGINTFDGVNLSGSGQRIAEFTDTSGLTGAYTYSAATLNIDGVSGSRVVTLPYDFMFVYTDVSGKADAPLADRSLMLRDVLSYFGLPFDPSKVTDAPVLAEFGARNYPNPFNPSTKIFYTMPKAGHLTLKVYSVRGELVKTLIDGQVKAGEDHVVWDGKNNQGANVSSGVYFYEARSGSNVVVNKMALVK